MNLRSRFSATWRRAVRVPYWYGVRSTGMAGLSRRGGGASRGGGGDGGSRDGPGGSVTLGTRVGAAGSGMVAVSWDAANAFGAAPAIAAGCAVGWGWGWAAAGNDCRARLRQLVEGCARHVRERQLARWNLLWLAMIAGMALIPLPCPPPAFRRSGLWSTVVSGCAPGRSGLRKCAKCYYSNSTTW